MANTRNIEYTTHKGGTAVYSNIPLQEKLSMLKEMEMAFFEAMEISNYDEEIRQALFSQDKDFNKHTASGNSTTNNCSASFLSGLFRQHRGNTGKDISVKMLPGISLASKLMNLINPKYTVYTFEEVEHTKSSRTHNTTFDNLFGKE